MEREIWVSGSRSKKLDLELEWVLGNRAGAMKEPRCVMEMPTEAHPEPVRASWGLAQI